MGTGFGNFNRRVHIHLGLFLLLFIWLFSFSGLVLNHGGWKFTNFWEQREEKNSTFVLPASSPDNLSASMVLELLKLKGEVEQVSRKQEKLEFRIVSPGLVHQVSVDVRTGLGNVKQLKFNFWGKLRTLHTFNGMQRDVTDQPPHWIAAYLWRLTMDGIALGLIVITLSSWIMWFTRRKEYPWSLAVIIMGFALAAILIFA